MDKHEKTIIRYKVPFWRSSRLFTAGMCFLVMSSMQAMRLNMSVAIVCMVNHTALQQVVSPTKNELVNISISVPAHHTTPGYNDIDLKDANTSTTSRGQDNTSSIIASIDEGMSRCMKDQKSQEDKDKEDGPFVWSKGQQGLILSAYYWGYVFCMLPDGWLVNRFNSVTVVGIATLLSAIFTLLIPLVTSFGIGGVILFRFLIGCNAGAFNPGVQNILAKWLPPTQRATIGSLVFTGPTCGTIAVFIFSGYMCKYGFADGWQSVFYLQGAVTLVFAIVWFIVVNEYPVTSSPEQPSNFEVECHDKDKQSKTIPWKCILTSKPVYAVIVCSMALDFYGTLSSVFLPTYFTDVMHFDITSNGFLSSLPYAFKSLLQFSGGLVSDVLLRKTSMSVGTSRKIVISTGKVVCATSIIALGFMNCEQSSIAVVLMVISLAAVGLMELGFSVNPIDIAASYAGLIVAIAGFIGNVFGLLSVLITTAIISENPTRESWQIVFIIVACFLLLTLTIHIGTASGQVQPWAVHKATLEIQIPLRSVHNQDSDVIREISES